ncbi:GIY-YIG nuclease family protein [Burkholderia diffusa]|uniref:GIY-YIG nuclease family protein n=1 Tax=Burkholderia diffusa TaxID=488732 RepID=UPI00157AB868|nr:GIY-YIG nuclease family protein [Burkholderia diffusa]NTY40727.1 GIY-YIG nuclease family protein [Burkholderia diffusa]
MSWFLYLIECADDSVYTGITTDVAARFDEHAAGKGARYTRSRKPRAVLASFPLPDRSSASRAEYWVKRLTPTQKRELAAGLRTLESVLPAGLTVDGNGEVAGLKAGARGRKKVKAKAENVDSATKTAEMKQPAAKTAKAGKAIKSAKTAKTRQAAKAPKAAKAAPVAKRAKNDGDAVVKKTASRGAPSKKDQQAASPSSKRKAPAANGQPVRNGRDALAPAPARRRPAATKAAEATVASVAPRRAKRTTGAKDAPTTTAPPASPSASKKTERAKQNRAAS